MRINRRSGRETIVRVALSLALTLMLTLVSAIGAAADSGSATYNYQLGTGSVAGTAFPVVGPDVAMASDGSTVSLTGTGTLSVHSKSVSGGGSFTVTDSGGNVTATGTWTAMSLLSFVSYGSASAQGLPPQNTGGEALIQVQLSTGPTAVLTAICLLGTPPSGKDEGVRLAVQGGPNFNQQVSGETDFILQ